MEFTEPINLGIKLYQELAALNTPDEIADMLRAHNIKAERNNGSSCAVSNYLAQRSGIPYIWTTSVSVILADISSYQLNKIPANDQSDHFGRFVNSRTLEMFIRKFDHGDYPDLVEPDSTDADRECPVCYSANTSYDPQAGRHIFGTRSVYYIQ